MGAFIKRHAVLILFVLGMATFGLTYHRQENLIAENHRLSVQTQELTQAIATSAEERHTELCTSQAELQAALRSLLLGLTDFVSPARQAELQRRVYESLSDPPEGC